MLFRSSAFIRFYAKLPIFAKLEAKRILIGNPGNMTFGLKVVGHTSTFSGLFSFGVTSFGLMSIYQSTVVQIHIVNDYGEFVFRSKRLRGIRLRIVNDYVEYDSA